MNKYSVMYEFQNVRYELIHQHQSKAFPDSEQMLEMAMNDALKHIDPKNPKTDVELISIIKI